MFLKDGKYDFDTASRQPPVGRRARHRGRPAPGVEGAGQRSRGRNWSQPAIALARDGFERQRRTGALARRACSPTSKKYPASLAQFSKNGMPYEAGDDAQAAGPGAHARRASPTRARPDSTKARPRALIEKEMKAQRRPDHAGRPEELPGQAARADYAARIAATKSSPCRRPARAAWRSCEMLNVLEGYDLQGQRATGRRRTCTSSRKRCAARSPTARATSAIRISIEDMPDRAADVQGIRRGAAQDHRPDDARPSRRRRSFAVDARERRRRRTLSVVDANRNAVALTYTLEERLRLAASSCRAPASC